MVAGAVYIVLQVYDLGAMLMYHAMRPYIDREKLEAAEKAADAFYMVNWKVIVCWFGLAGYLAFLGTLKSLASLRPMPPRRRLRAMRQVAPPDS
jgi:hypothetical protein